MGTGIRCCYRNWIENDFMGVAGNRNSKCHSRTPFLSTFWCESASCCASYSWRHASHVQLLRRRWSRTDRRLWLHHAHLYAASSSSSLFTALLILDTAVIGENVGTCTESQYDGLRTNLRVRWAVAWKWQYSYVDLNIFIHHIMVATQGNINNSNKVGINCKWRTNLNNS